MTLRGSQTVAHRVRDMLTAALGPVGVFLADPTVIEIMTNPDGRVWVERLGEPPRCSGERLAPGTIEQIIRLVASSLGAECHAGAPSLSAVLPGDGARFQGFVPPVVTQPAFVIRQRALRVFTLEDYVEDGTMTAAQALALADAVTTRQNLVIAGGTGSGKTTLANAVLACMAETGDRIVTIEDTPELQCTAPNHLALYTREGVATMQQLVKETMRCRPDRIIVGEVRDGAALDLLKAWGTGHPGGLCTLHANGAAQSLTRLEQLVQEAVVTVPRALIADAVDLMVYLARTPRGRQVHSLAAVTGLVGDQYVVETR
ncbi:MAG: P-type conjugative transfer ATPase TrbB [Candidatus Tectimicrobiota bacterium]